MLRYLKLAWAAPLLGIALAGVLHGCGGGGQTASNNTGGVGSGGTGSYTNGPISGLGSIIVNGVRYDVDSATLLSDDMASPVNDDLQIGLVVEVDGGAITRGSGGANDAARALRVRYASELIGEVSSPVGATATTAFTVMGQRVLVNARTVPLSAPLQAGDKVVVHGLPTALGEFTATRVDVLPSQPAAYKVSGLVGRVDPGRIEIGRGPQVVTFSGSVPPGLVVGSYARVRVLPAALPTSTWSAVAGGIGVRSQLVSEERRGRLEGVIQNFDASNSGVVNGTTVNFTSVRAVLGASPNGLRVEVSGLYRSGVLVADMAELDDDNQPGENELHGRIDQWVPSTSFRLRGILVNYASASVEPGLGLANGVCVEVKGSLAGPNLLQATEVKSDNDCR